MVRATSSKALRWLAPLLVLLLAAWLLRHLDWQALRESFARVNPWLLLPLVALLGLHFITRAWRWGLLVGHEKKIPLKDLYDATMVGFMANFLLPFRAGELIRPWVLCRWQSISFGSVLASTVLERILDALVVIGFLGISVGYLHEKPDWLGPGAKLLGLIAFAGLALILIAYFLTDPFTKLIRRLLSLVFRGRLAGIGSKLNHLLEGFIAGLKAIHTFKQLLLVISASILVWLELTLFYQVGLRTMGLELPWSAGLMVNVLVALAVAAPGPPGFLGTFQIGCLAALGLYGIGKEATLSFSIVMHVLQALCIIAAGLWALRSRGLGIRTTLSGTPGPDEARTPPPS